MAGIEVFTPVFRTPDMASPASRRRRPLALVSTNQSSNLSVNDDAAEKRQRRISRVTSVALSSPSTPRSSSRLDSERGQTASGLTNCQLKDLYSNCIKLSTENKINSKNAFGLDLIDYMQDLIKTVKEGEMTNFQVASCTLDASAKIYAGRVDSIHAQAYKMLGGLGRAENQDEENCATEEGAADDEQSNKKRNKKNNHKPGNTIETNKKNLNVNQFDLEFEVDPLFHKTSAVFDEGGTQGLLLNFLSVCDDSCELLLDSNAIVTPARDSTTEAQSTKDSSMVDLSELRDVYSSVNFNAFQICPHFSEFEFTNWNKEEQKSHFTAAMAKLGSEEHAFDINAPATETEMDYPEPMGGDFSEDDMPDIGDMEFGRDGCEGSAFGGTSHPSALANATLAFADGREAQLVSGQDGSAGTLGSAISTLGTLCLELSEQPNEYSYFKSSMLATWAGPEHWKMRARLSKLAGLATNNTDQDQSKKKKTKKDAFKVDFDAELDYKIYFTKGRAATTLAKSTLEKLSSDKTTLPEDLHYDADNLFRLFIKPKIMVRRQAVQTQPEVADDGSAWYNYDNPNDAANYCPAGSQDDDEDDDITTGGDLGPPDMTQVPDMTCDMTNSSQGLNDTNGMDLTMFAGDGLVSQPNKVQKIDIAYAKTAKKMDVKKLKEAMWKLIQDTDINKENIPNEVEPEVHLNKDEFSDPRSFKEIYGQLPASISKHMAKNLSVPIAFVCILHLANEKCLKMTPCTDMSDFAVKKDS
ncbi:condensin complex subunit 2 [Nematostella vectensis]|uniref:condensin complex subunit 2 n=1 Tax=Nematostella vectensis TaxID=45351 RepID=UPI002076ED1C|nr:condensin complex subunit 2 [Nematostella vectensis]